MSSGPPSRSVTVRDGSVIRIRPIEPADRSRLATALDELSDQSRYQRFLSPMPRLSAAQLDYLTDVDHRDHEALVALDQNAERLIGVARYVRTDTAVAEPAVAVADDWQRRGVGTALLERLVDRAIEEGVTTFAGHVLADNPAPLRLLGEVGDVIVRNSGGASEVQVHLRGEAAAARAGTLRTLLRTFAEPGLGAWQRVVPPGRGRLEDERHNVIVAAVAPSGKGIASRMADELAAASSATVVLVSGEPVAVLRAAAEHRARLIVVQDAGVAGLRGSSRTS